MDIEQDAPVVSCDDSAAPVSEAPKKRKGRFQKAAAVGFQEGPVAALGGWEAPERIDNLSRLDILQAVSDAARSNETSELHDGHGRTWHVSPEVANNHSVILLRAVRARVVAMQTVPTSLFSVSPQPAHDAIDAICAQLP